MAKATEEKPTSAKKDDKPGEVKSTAVTAPRDANAGPEFKVGPMPQGYGISVWRNTTEDGRHFRSITIEPRRYLDEQGNWQDAKSFRVIDLEVLIMALEKVRDYCRRAPLPTDVADHPNGEGGDIPF